jgi:cbb3-type cytochrome oxidase maturation protein
MPRNQQSSLQPIHAQHPSMDILYLLIPLSILAMFGVLAVFAWALHGGQFDELEAQGQRVLLDPDPTGRTAALEQLPPCH